MRSVIQTLCPLFRGCLARWRPMKPFPPVTNISAVQHRLHDSDTRISVSERVFPIGSSLNHFFRCLQHRCWVSSCHLVGAHFHRLRSFRVLSDRHAGIPEDTRLLLHPSRIGQDQPRVSLELKEAQIVDGLEETHARARLQPELADPLRVRGWAKKATGSPRVSETL